MNNPTFHHKQQGAVLFVALIMLLVLTLLAVGSMRGSTLEGRITANRAHDTQKQNAADAALREAEYRYYLGGQANLIDKLESKPDNCVVGNTIQASKLAKPCLLSIKTDNLKAFVENPGNLEDTFLQAVSNKSILWMPYNGIDPDNASQVTVKSGQTVDWNSIRAVSGNNVEYGMELEGKGTYYYLNNARTLESGNQHAVYLQSTNANIYMGLNN